MAACVIGLDFGSLSCRGLLVRQEDGLILAEAETAYPHGVLTRPATGEAWPEGTALQDPEDFLYALTGTIRALLSASGAADAQVAAIGIDATASTVIPIREDGAPLCADSRFQGNPDALAIMWKDHRAVREAERLTELLRVRDPGLLQCIGGSVGAESLIPKVIRLCLTAPEVYKTAYAFVELGDWMTSRLTGRMTMSRTALTCKALFRNGTGYPDATLFTAIDERLAGLTHKLMPRGTDNTALGYPGEPAGTLCREMADTLGLREKTIITFSQLDGYAGLPGAGVTAAGELLLTVGTSTGFFLLAEEDRPIEGVCAAVRDCMLPGYTGIAAGQAASGDAFAWYMDNAVPASYRQAAEQRGVSIHEYMCEKVRELPESAPHLIALDWINGNKSPLNRPDLTGMILGLTLDTKPEQIYRTMMEATAFGARRVVETLEAQRVGIHRILANGGIAQKNPLMMQLYADVLQKPVAVVDCAQTAALGSAMAASAAAKPDGHAHFPEIIRRMSPGTAATYLPDPGKKDVYDRLYREYVTLSDYFSSTNQVMRKLRIY